MSIHSCGQVPLFYTVCVIVFVILALLCSLVVFITSVYKFLLGPSEKFAKTKSWVKALVLCTLLFFMIFTIPLLLPLYVSLNCPSTAKESKIYHIGVTTYFLFGGVPYILSYYIFITRLVISFKDSVIPISNFSKFLLHGLIFILILYYTCSNIIIIQFYLNFNTYAISESYIMYAVPVFVLIYVICYVTLLTVFIKQIRLCSHVLFKNNEEQRIMLFNMATKCLTCVLCAIGTTVSTTMIFAIVMNVNNNIIENETTSQIIWCLLMALMFVEVLLNMMSIILQFSHFENIYDKYFKCCDQCIKSCFASSLNKIVTNKNNQIVADVVNVTNYNQSKDCMESMDMPMTNTTLAVNYVGSGSASEESTPRTRVMSVSSQD